MKKVWIVGCVASGKTTLAKRLSLQLNIPWHELDCLVHHELGRTRTPEEQVEAIKEIDRNGCWIFEGVDRTSYHCLYEMSDTIIFLDPPLWKRRWRIVKRFLKQRLGFETCHYNPDFWMLRMMFKWTSDFEANRDHMEKKMELYRMKVVRLRGDDFCLPREAA